MSLPLILLIALNGAITAAPTSSVTDEDAISLGGQAFAVVGPISGKPVSEFEQGFKTGRARYDNREHAFFLVMDDFSGGFGHRFMDLDADIGTFWDVNPDNAPDTRRPGHVTLGPSRTTQTLSFAYTSPTLIIGRAGRNVINYLGDALILMGGGIHLRVAGGSAWANVASVGGGGSGSFAILGNKEGSASRLFAFFSSGRYLKTPDSVTLTAWEVGASNITVSDGIAWDDKIVGAVGQNTLGYAIWDTTLNKEVWNFEDPDDSQYLWFNVESFFAGLIGTFPAPWGEPAIHFYSPTLGIFALDFFARKAYSLDVGLTRFIQHATPFNGTLAFTDGWNIRLYSNENVRSITPIDLPTHGGTPPSMESATGGKRAAIQYLIPSDNYLYAIATRKHSTGSGGDAFFMCYNGVGWAPIGEVILNFFPQGGAQFDATGAIFSTVPVPRSIMVPGFDFETGGATARGQVIELDIPDASQAPRVGTDTFAASGAYLITGWTDGGFSDFDGTLFRLSIDAFSLTTTETVKVEYQLDNNESGDWIQMVSSGNVASVFDQNTRTLYFAQPSGLDNPQPKKGIAFRTVRFRITLNRGSNATLSPEIRALTLVYLKTPNLRTQWTFRVDVSRMIERSTEGNDSGGYTVDGNAATILNVWTKLKELWNTHTLLELTLPNVEESLLVKLVDMPLSVDDFQDAVLGRGFVDITVLEPVA